MAFRFDFALVVGCLRFPFVALDECTCWSTSVLKIRGGHLCFIDCLCCRPFRRIVVGVCGIQVRLRLGGGLPSVSLGGAGRVYLLEHLGFEQLGPPTCVSSIGCVATFFVA